MLAAWPPRKVARPRGRPAGLDIDNDRRLRESMAMYILGLSSTILKRDTKRIGTRVNEHGEKVGKYRTRASLIETRAPPLSDVVPIHALARLFGFEPAPSDSKLDEPYDDFKPTDDPIDTEPGAGAFNPAFQRVWWGKPAGYWENFYDAALSRMKSAYASHCAPTDRQRTAFLLCELTDFLEPARSGHLRFNIPKSRPEVLALFTKESSLIAVAGLHWERGPAYGQNKITLPNFEKFSSAKGQPEGAAQARNKVRFLKPIISIVRASGLRLLRYQAGDIRTAIRPDPEDWSAASKWPVPIQIAQQYINALTDFESVDGIDDDGRTETAKKMLPSLSHADIVKKQVLLNCWKRGVRGKKKGTRNRHE